ncbi:MAG: NAD(P)H-dependent oxidoreductase [Mariniblastus sp.]|nr:NAD(P)H-dependent oxidoreductase [Mariniblastus sp.]
MFLVLSTSLSENSRSRILARFAAERLRSKTVPCQWVDLAELPLPTCDAGPCYADPNVQQVNALIQEARGILIAAPVYNYNLSASAKNLIELTGKSWTDKVVGFLCAAGGQSSYMGVLALANSLMLDFRTVILPRFVYATGESFSGNEIAETDVEQRIDELVDQLIRFSTALHP